jgi:hypothetical protein
MSAEDFTQPQDEGRLHAPRRLLARYAFLTAALFLPLLWSFATLKNIYPLAAWTVMLRGAEGPARQRSYYVLRGETLTGETFELAPVTLTGQFGVRSWGLVSATVENKSFKIPSPHPSNAAFAEASGGVDRLPRAARLPQLLRAWGEEYNSRLPPDSARRLKAIRLDGYGWDPERGREPLTESWREEL